MQVLYVDGNRQPWYKGRPFQRSSSESRRNKLDKCPGGLIERDGVVFVAERRMNLARPFKAGIAAKTTTPRRVSDD